MPRLVAAVMLIVTFFLGCHSNIDQYPECPFEHVVDGFPEIIPLAEEPLADDAEQYDAYWERWDNTFEISMNETIMADRPQVEKDLFSAINDGQYALARKLSEQILRKDSESMIGLYSMAHVEAFAEGDLPYALNSIRRMRQQAEAMGEANPRDPIGQEWYVRALSTEWDILNAMDRSEEVILVADRIESVFAPVPWLKSFALIKLERFDEATAEIAKYKGSGKFEVNAHNSLMVIEDKKKSRQSSLEAARAMCEQFPQQQVLQYNLGLASINNAKFGEAEQAFLAAAKATDGLSNSTPYAPLAALLVQQGRFSEALDAMKKAQVDRGEREPYTLQDDEANTNLAIASVLLAHNRSDLAIRFARRATDSPDRPASTSNDLRDLRVSDALILWTIQKYEREELQEQLSVGSKPTASTMAEIALLQTSMWATKQKFTSELSRDRVIDLVSPYTPGSPGIETQMQSWHRFMLLDLVPLGVLEVALTEAAKVEKQPWIPAYLNAIHAAVRLRKGDDTEALRLANESLHDLPPRAEKVFRAFVSAIAGKSAWELGKYRQAIGFWSATMRDFPQAFRLLDIQIPIRLTHQGSDFEQEIVSTLASSRRFFEHGRGCIVNLRPFDSQQLLIEMFRNDQSHHMELIVQIASDDGFAEVVVEDFHQKFFQPLVELTQSDLGSLDGSPIAARMRREVDQLFSDLVEGEDPPEESASKPASQRN